MRGQRRWLKLWSRTVGMPVGLNDEDKPEFLPSFETVEIINIYQEVKWYFPKLKFGHILCSPIENKDDPACAYFVKETNKIPDVLSTEDLW